MDSSRMVAIFCIPLLLTQAGCTPTQIETSVNLGVAAAVSLVDSLSASGAIPPGIAPIVSTYTGPALAALDSIAAEIASTTDSAAVKTAKISEVGLATVDSFNALPLEAQAITGSLNAALVGVLTSLGIAVPTVGPSTVKTMYAMGFTDPPVTVSKPVMPKNGMMLRFKIGRLRAKIHAAQKKLVKASAK